MLVVQPRSRGPDDLQEALRLAETYTGECLHAALPGVGQLNSMAWHGMATRVAADQLSGANQLCKP